LIIYVIFVAYKINYLLNLILKSCFNGLIVLVSVIFLVSAIIFLSPVDPARLTFGQRLDESTLQLKKQELGLDKPLFYQVIQYLGDISPFVVSSKEYKTQVFKIGVLASNKNIVLKFPDFRFSFQSGRNVDKLLVEAFPKTIILALTAFIFAMLIGILMGIIAAIKQGSTIDTSILTISTLGISLPSYVTAMVFALVFGYILHDITGFNLQGSIFEIDDLGNDIFVPKNIILPALALGLRPVSVITQITRAVMVDVLKMDYIRTAKAKGLKFKEIIISHTLRNAANPIATTVSGWFASLLAGAFFVEYVFNFKGLGSLTINSLINYDVPVLLACLIVVCTIFIIVNILMDILYRIIDPSIQY
jgi:peptide/nickel transport system permease protein